MSICSFIGPLDDLRDEARNIGYYVRMKKGILKLDGAHCASCAYTIEHVGRKIAGIKEVLVRAGEQKVYVDYEGDESVLDKVADIVKTIGYSAVVLEKDSGEA